MRGPRPPRGLSHAGTMPRIPPTRTARPVDAARRRGITIDWLRHARTGVPVTLLSLALAGGWLAL